MPTTTRPSRAPLDIGGGTSGINIFLDLKTRAITDAEKHVSCHLTFRPPNVRKEKLGKVWSVLELKISGTFFPKRPEAAIERGLNGTVRHGAAWKASSF